MSISIISYREDKISIALSEAMKAIKVIEQKIESQRILIESNQKMILNQNIKIFECQKFSEIRCKGCDELQTGLHVEECLKCINSQKLSENDLYSILKPFVGTPNNDKTRRMIAETVNEFIYKIEKSN